MSHEEIIARMKKEGEEQRRAEKRTYLSLIPYFHGVFARTKNPDALEVAKNLGQAINKQP